MTNAHIDLNGPPPPLTPRTPLTSEEIRELNDIFPPEPALTASQIGRVLAEVVIPRHWHTVMVKRGSRQMPMIEIQDLEEVVSAVMFNVRQDLDLAILGTFRDECPDCERPINMTDHADCDL